MANRWTREELILAWEFALHCPEKMQTDSHPKCQQVADEIGRSPGALDKIMRNMKFADTVGVGLPNASEAIRSLIKEFKGKRQALMSEAQSIRKRRKLKQLKCF